MTTITQDLTRIATESQPSAPERRRPLLTPRPTPGAQPPNHVQALVAGAAAEGHGALAGWVGAGQLTRAQIIEALTSAGLPSEWAPASKSDVAHLGDAIARARSHGYIVRRARAASWRRSGGNQTRAYRARWLVIRAHDEDGGQVGERTGIVDATIELYDGSSELSCTSAEHAADVVADVRTSYADLQASEVFQAGDVTQWLRQTLIGRAGAARFGVGYYVPAAGRGIAQALVSAISARWGTSWISPLLPVASSAELALGVARGFSEDVQTVAHEFQRLRAEAREKKREDISGRVAARLLRDLHALDQRALAYRALCGDEVLAETVAQLRGLRAELEPLADHVSLRFELCELAPENEAVEYRELDMGPVSRAADEALDRRRAEHAERLPEDWTPEGLRGWTYDGTEGLPELLALEPGEDCGCTTPSWCSLSDCPRAPRVETAPEARVETAPEARVETAPEARVETAPEARVETVPEARVETGAYSGLADDLALGDVTSEHRGRAILGDIARRFARHRSLSDRQIALVRRLANEIRNEEQLCEAPTGRAEFEGEIVSVRLDGEAYSCRQTWKMLVKVSTDQGVWKAWGTVPVNFRGVDDLRGRRARLRATLVPKELGFAIMKRPSGTLDPGAAS